MTVAESAAPALERSLTDDLASIAERLTRSTVQVRSDRHGAGSGVIWGSDGLIITNAHVAHGTRATVELWDGRTFDATVVSRDPARDLAALEVQARDLPAAPVGDSDTLRVGQVVVAVGNPLGITSALTTGIVHAIAPARGRGPETWVRADVELLPGNSGGPLADALGRVVGINSMVAGGLGLAVPSNVVHRFLRDRGERPQLGIVTQPVLATVQGQQTPGLVVLDVASGSRADLAGLIVGDIVVGLGGQRFGDLEELGDFLAQADIGDTVHLDLVRGGIPATLDVVLTPESEERAAGEAA